MATYYTYEHRKAVQAARAKARDVKRSEEFCRAVSAGKTGKPKRAPYTCPNRKGSPWTEARRAAQKARVSIRLT